MQQADIAPNRANSLSSESPAIISLLLPTRGRALLANRFFQSVVNTTETPESVEIVVYVDDDDTESHYLDCPDITFKKTIGPRLSMGGYNSYCLKQSEGEIIILVNDDMVIRTDGWDTRIRQLHKKYPDGIYLAYGNDLFKGGKLCTFPILSRRTCEVLVDPYPEEYRGAFIDYHLFDIFKRLEKLGNSRIIYLDDVVFEHLHYRAGKAEKDETYIKRDRFADDPIFLGLIKSRMVMASRLFQTIHGNNLPVYTKHDCERISNKGFLSTVHYYFRNLFFDFNLPFRWRVWLWFWFQGRYLASLGWLRPFLR